MREGHIAHDESRRQAPGRSWWCDGNTSWPRRVGARCPLVLRHARAIVSPSPHRTPIGPCRYLWTGGAANSKGGTCPTPIVTNTSCAMALRALCTATSPPQKRAMMYSFAPGGCKGDPSKLTEFEQDLVRENKDAWWGRSASWRATRLGARHVGTDWRIPGLEAQNVKT